MGSPSASAIILARMDSRRFPGKALSQLAGLPLIEHALRRLEGCAFLDAILLATTQRSCDDILAERFVAMGGRVYRGPDEEVNNVARRFVSAANAIGAEYALRANGDSPLLDRWLVGQGMRLLDAETDLVTNLLPRTYPYGVSVEIVKVATLERELPALDDGQRQHLTACFYAAPERFKVIAMPPSPWPPCEMRLTVDLPEDIERLTRIIERLPGPLTEVDVPTFIAAARKLQSESK